MNDIQTWTVLESVRDQIQTDINNGILIDSYLVKIVQTAGASGNVVLDLAHTSSTVPKASIAAM